MEERKPAEVFPPGDMIRDELAERGWTQVDLAEILGVSVSGINEILNDRRGITAEVARGLAEAFGTTAEVWLNLDARYRLHGAEPRPGTRLRSQIYGKAPVREMIKRGWIETSSNPEVLATTVCRFLGISSLDEEPRPFPHAARKATSYAETTAAQDAWLCRVKQIGLAAPTTGHYDPSRFEELVETLKALTPNEAELRRVPRVLADFGVRFLIVEDLPRSKIDGVCVWFDRHSPAIALSLRYGRVDSFWFSLFHELAHMKAGDGLRQPPMLDTELIEGEKSLPLVEKAANRFAVETLVPQQDLDHFVARVGPSYTNRNIANFAARIGVHPALVIGQLAHPDRGEFKWSRFGSAVRSIRDYVTGSAITDGWGNVVPVSD